MIQFRYLDVLFGGTQTAFDGGLSATSGLEGPVCTPLARRFNLNGFNTNHLVAGQCINFAPPTPCVTLPANMTVVVTTCPAPVNFVVLNNGTCGTVTVSPPSGSNFNVGVTTVNVTSCLGTKSFTVTVQETIPPVIVGCPKGVVTLNAGPGECGSFWDAPPFMAMDNCAVGNIYIGAETLSTGCPLNANNGLTATTFNIGMLFDVVNLGTAPLAISSIKFMPWNNPGNTYAVYLTTNPVSFVGVLNNPAAWTKIGGDSVKVGVNGAFPPAVPRGLTRFEMGATAADTTLDCEGDFVINTRTALTGVINPGETRGMAIYGVTAGSSFFYTNAAAPCNTTIQGNGVLGIDVRSARVQYGASPFVVAGTFLSRMFNGDICYKTERIATVPIVQTCGAPYSQVVISLLDVQNYVMRLQMLLEINLHVHLMYA